MKVIIICAVTLDGKIARGLNDPIDWTPKADKEMFARETKKAGVVIMGHNTFNSIGRPLKERLNVVLSRELKNKVNQIGVLEYTDRPAKKLLENLRRRGFRKVFVIGGSRVNSLFLRAGLVDEIWLTLAPKIFGKGVGLFGSDLPEINLRLLSTRKTADGFIFLRYGFIRSGS